MEEAPGTGRKSGVDVLLGDAVFVSVNEGWAVGRGWHGHTHKRTVARPGKKQASDIGKDLFNVFFLDAQNGWAVGEYGTIIHTGDGGKTWAKQIEPKDALYNNVFFADPQTGWVVGEFGTILHTADGGTDLDAAGVQGHNSCRNRKELDRPKPALYGIFFLDRNQGWITGMDGVIIKTTDGGQTWTKLPW